MGACRWTFPDMKQTLDYLGDFISSPDILAIMVLWVPLSG